jgi:hypothetical protein
MPPCFKKWLAAFLPTLGGMGRKAVSFVKLLKKYANREKNTKHK